MKKSTILLVALFCSSVYPAYAQERKVEQTVRMDTINVEYKTRYISDSFWDNFYLQGSLTGSMLQSSDDTGLSFGKRIKPGFNLSVGKQFHPDFGVRLGFSGMRLDGWTHAANGLYAYDDGWTQEFDPVEAYWQSQGVDTKNGYKQEIKYFEVNADFLFDLYNIFTRNNRWNKRWTAEGYVGLGYLRALKYHGMEDNKKVAFRIGLKGEYRFTSRLGINLEIGSNITDASFTGEIGKGDRYCNILTASIGLRWNISRTQGFRVVRLMPQAQIDELNNVISTITHQTYEESDTVMQQRQVAGTLLIPSVVFNPGEDQYNVELQELNIFRMAQYLMRYKDIRVAVVGNTGKTNDYLARKRAEKIRDILVNRYGIFPERLEIRVYDINAKYHVNGYDESVNFTIAE